jgi:hypothetical protein
MIRRLGIWLALGLINWIGEHILGQGPYPSVRLEIGWWCERQCSRLFAWCYDGSEQECADAVEYSEEEIPSEELSPRACVARLLAEI